MVNRSREASQQIKLAGAAGTEEEPSNTPRAQSKKLSSLANRKKRKAYLTSDSIDFALGQQLSDQR